MKSVDETDRVEAAVEGVAPDVQLVRPLPDDPRHRQELAQDLVRTLLIRNCTWFRVRADPPLAVAEGWYDRPEIERAYERPAMVRTDHGFSRDLTVEARRKLRHIVRRTHRVWFRDEPTNAMLDELIDSLGPEVAAKMVKAAADRGQI